MGRKTIADLFSNKTSTLDEVVNVLASLTPNGATVSDCATTLKHWLKKRKSWTWGGPPIEVSQEMAYATHGWIAQHCGCDETALRASVDCFDACVRAGIPQYMAFTSLEYLCNICKHFGGNFDAVRDAVESCRDAESKQVMLEMLW
tara:strand:- start:35159 stop:35596 length:438 start_codon:yes stop_codon:yes gene_type:complete